ncbi:RNA polymerase-associated protein RapA [compost metagenome]
MLAKQFAIAESKVAPRHAERVEKARHQLLATLDEELARLTALKEVNPSVRDSELDALRKQRDDSLALLDKASLRLEAIRVLVAG